MENFVHGFRPPAPDVLLAPGKDLQKRQGFLHPLIRTDVLHDDLGFAIVGYDERLLCVGDVPDQL